MAKVYLGLGSNLGDRRANLAAAIDGLSRLSGTRVVKIAGIYETAPVGGPAGQGMFLNSAVMIETTLVPADLLRRILELEDDIGRVRDADSPRWGPRPIDIDILFWEGVIMDEPDLTIPHPRVTEREFALRAMMDLDSRLRHPLADRNIEELLSELEKEK